MIKKLKENYNEYFEFDIYIPICLFHNVIESTEDKLSSNILKIPKKLTQQELNEVSYKVQKIVDNFATDTIDKIAKEYGCKLLDGITTGSSLKSTRNKEELSFACYYKIQIPTPITNVSTNVQNKVSEFKIRIANHLSTKELRTLADIYNLKIFNQYMVDMYKPELEIYTANIMEAMTNFVDKIENYADFVETMSDIKMQDLQQVKDVAAQGDFPELNK